MDPSNSIVHKGLEASDIFYFAGHGNPEEIGATKSWFPWSLFGDPWKIRRGVFTNSQRAHDPAPDVFILLREPYRFVFLDACETGKDSNWASAFGVPGENNTFLGWREIFEVPWIKQKEWLLNLLGLNTTEWTLRLLEKLSSSNSLSEAMEYAGSDSTTENIRGNYVPTAYGDLNKHLR